jgi:ribulose-phosphate 3-epimerase
MNVYEQLKSWAPTVSVGVLTADLLRLGEELAALEQAQIRVVHVDVMDGVFCPQMTVGAPFVKAINGPFVKEVHLMIDQPEEKVHAFIDTGADIIIFHPEGTRHSHRVLQVLTAANVVRGVALNPGTPVEVVEPLVGLMDYVLLLAVDPGWSGQRFDPATGDRLRLLQTLVGEQDVMIGVDGGITRENVAEVAALGPDVIVTGSAVFDGKAPLDNARYMLDQVRPRARLS